MEEQNNNDVTFLFLSRSMCPVCICVSCIRVKTVWLPTVPGPSSIDGGYSTFMMMMIGWLVFATALFLLRPPSLRDHGDSKPSSSGVSLNGLLLLQAYAPSLGRVDVCLLAPDVYTDACYLIT